MKSLGTWLLAGMIVFISTAGAVRGQEDEIAEGKKLLEEEKFEDAIAKFESALKKEGKAYDARVGLARCYFGLRDWDQANFHAVRGEKLNPKGVEACELTGITFRYIGEVKAENKEDPSADWEQAIESFRRASDLDPKNVGYCVHIGQLGWNLGNFKVSAEAYEKAAAIDPKNITYVDFAAQCWVRAGDPDKALASIEKAIAANPNIPALKTTRGNALAQQNKKAEAVKAYLDALTTKSETRDHIVAAAQAIWNVYAADKNFAEMSAAYGTWAKAVPTEPESRWWNGFALNLVQRHDDALAEFREYDKLMGGNHPEGHYRIGETLAHKGDIDAAIESFTAAAKKPFQWSTDASHNPVLQIEILGGRLFNDGKFDKSVKANEAALQLVNDDNRRCTIRQNIGFLYREWGSAARNDEGGEKRAKELWTKSREHYDAAVKLLPKTDIRGTQRAQIINDCGLMYHYYDIADLDAALKLYRAALESDPKFGDAILNVGRAYIRLGKFQDAIDILEKGEPERVDIQMELRNAKAKLAKEKK